MSYDDYDDTGIDVKEMIKESMKEIAQENAQENAQRRRAQDMEKVAVETLQEEGVNPDDLKAYANENPEAVKNATLKAHKNYLRNLAQSRKQKRGEVGSNPERRGGKWEKTQTGQGMTAQGGVKYHPTEDLKQRAASGDTTAFDDMVGDIIKGL